MEAKDLMKAICDTCYKAGYANGYMKGSSRTLLWFALGGIAGLCLSLPVAYEAAKEVKNNTETNDKKGV